MATVTRKGSLVEGKEDGVQQGKCGICKKIVTKSEKGVQCEMCEGWFHCKCEDLSEDTYKLLGQDKIHYFCSTCDKITGKVLKSITELHLRQNKLEERVDNVVEEIKQIGGKKWVQHDELEKEFKKVREELRDMRIVRQEEMEREFKKVRVELKEVREGVAGGSRKVQKEEEDIMRLQKEVGEMKTEMEMRVTTSAKIVKEDVDERLEIERRKGNLIIHGVPESNAEKDIDEVAKILGEGLKLDFTRHVDKMERIGREVEGRPRPIRMKIKNMDGRKEILSRAKNLKDTEEFKRMFISPDLTRRQQEADRELRQQLKRIREGGVQEARIKNGKIVKNVRGGREEILYQPTNQM